jgi:hypothetical protein
MSLWLSATNRNFWVRAKVLKFLMKMLCGLFEKSALSDFQNSKIRHFKNFLEKLSQIDLNPSDE